MIKISNLSIVIPTIGDKDLFSTLDLLFEKISDHSNIEIIVSIYEKNFYKIKSLKNKHLKIIKTKYPGQVYQRAEGFKEAKNDYILQLDDDCIISLAHIQSMLDLLIKSKKNLVISPIYFDKISGLCIHKLKNDSFYKFIKNIITIIFCGSKWGKKRLGTISKVGTNFGVDIDYLDEDLKEIEWAPGGCLLHCRKNLILDNYFPFQGKAYCEDLIHSFLLKKKLIKIFVYKHSHCITDFPLFPTDRYEINNYLQAYKYFNQLNSSLNFRFYIWYYLNYIRNFF